MKYLFTVLVIGFVVYAQDAEKKRKYAYASGCFEATAITFNAVSKKELNNSELSYISNVCKGMYSEWLKHQN